MEMLLLFPKLGSWKKAATITMAICQWKADNEEYANSGYKTINLRIKIHDESNFKRLIKHIKMCDAFCNQESYKH